MGLRVRMISNMMKRFDVKRFLQDDAETENVLVEHFIPHSQSKEYVSHLI
jgi:hypothetical protein